MQMHGSTIQDWTARGSRSVVAPFYTYFVCDPALDHGANRFDLNSNHTRIANNMVNRIRLRVGKNNTKEDKPDEE